MLILVQSPSSWKLVLILVNKGGGDRLEYLLRGTELYSVRYSICTSRVHRMNSKFVVGEGWNSTRRMRTGWTDQLRWAVQWSCYNVCCKLVCTCTGWIIRCNAFVANDTKWRDANRKLVTTRLQIYSATRIFYPRDGVVICRGSSRSFCCVRQLEQFLQFHQCVLILAGKNK